MTGTADGRRDFFISFTGADRPWARWLARVLGEEAYSFWFQGQDFHGCIPRSISEAHTNSNRTIAVLSEAYTTSGYCRSEWEMRYQEDPGSAKDLLILFRISPCMPDPVLAQISYVDLFGCDEATARERVHYRLRQAVEPGDTIKIPLGETVFPGRALVEAPFPVPPHNLSPPNPDFVGRENALAAIRAALTKGAPGAIARAYAITGLGGVGKTQTALIYGYHHLADYHLIWWLRAAEPATLAADFMTLAGPLGLPEERDQAKAVQAVKAKLQATPGWLLVFDNAEDPATVRPYLPGTGGGHALLTSRRTDWQGTAAQGILDVLSEPEALQLLAGRPDPEALATAELAEATALAQDLGSLPLALAQARAYMAETGEGFGGYRALLRMSGVELLGDERASSDYPEPVARTWDLSLRAAEQQCPAARPLLELLAFFAPAALSREVLDAEPEALPEGLRDKLARNRAIGTLHRFSLIRAEAGTITVHRLVQAVTRDGLGAATAKARAGAAVRLVKAALPDPMDHTHWPMFRALLPHALATAEAAEHLEAGLETAATVLNNTALYHEARAAYAEAEPLYQRALAILEKVLEPEHPSIATVASNFAELYWVAGRYAEAEPLCQRARAIGEKVLGPEHPGLATSLNSLAGLYRATGRYAEAEPLYQRALAIWEKVLGPEHPYTVTVTNNLAGIYHETGRYAEAEPLYQRAIAISENTIGKEHPDVAIRLNNLAGLYSDTGRYAEAEPLYQRAIAISEKALGPEHPDLATSLNNLAGLYSDTGRYAEAEPLYQRVLSIFEKTLGPEHPDLASVLNNLAGLYRDTGRYAEAEPLCQRARAIGEKVLGPEHPGLATSLNNLAGLYRDTGRYAEAEPLYQRALAILEKVLEPEHPNIVTATNNLAGLYRDTGRYAEAEPLCQRAIAISEKTLPPDHPHLMWARENYAGLLDQLGRHAEAAELRAQAQAILGPPHQLKRRRLKRRRRSRLPRVS